MKELPPFNDFLKSINMNKFLYDLNRFSEMMKNSGEDVQFSKEQLEQIAMMSNFQLFAYLQQYHEWLSLLLQQWD